MREGEKMKSFVTFSVLLAISLLLAGCGRQSATNTSSVQTDALFRATREGNTDMVKSLLSSPGADVNASDGLCLKSQDRTLGGGQYRPR